MSRSQPRRQIQDPSKHPPNACLRKQKHCMERSPPWGDAFCLHKHGNWESRAAEARTSGGSKAPAATAEQQTEKADNPLPNAREASGTLVSDSGSAGDGPSGLSSALQSWRRGLPAAEVKRKRRVGLGGCSAMDAPDSTPGRAHWGLVL